MELKRVWRLCQRRYAQTAFSGIGAKLHGGRWNEPGLPVVYTADSLALAALETFVHLDPDLLPDDFVAIAATIPEHLPVARLRVEDLPDDWQNYPAPDVLKRLGSDWFHSQSAAALAVPSVIIPQEENWLFNPSHQDFPSIVIAPPTEFKFDARMWKR